MRKHLTVLIHFYQHNYDHSLYYLPISHIDPFRGQHLQIPMRETLLKHLSQQYVGWELYWCVAITLLTILYAIINARMYHKAVREKDEIIAWNLQERIKLEKVIEKDNDSISALREKVRYYKGLAKSKTYRKP